MLVFCFVAQLCLILDQIMLFTVTPADGSSDKGNVFQWTRHRILQLGLWDAYERAVVHKFTWLSVLRLHTAESVLSTTSSFILFATEIAFACLNVILITDYAHILLPNSSQALNLKDWSLGQVIAVTIWIPVLLEYVWLVAGMQPT